MTAMPAGIAVIVGTPTYAVPAWLAAKHPDILVTTVAGQQKYGPRQIMDIVNPTFRRYAEKIIRTLMAHVQHISGCFAASQAGTA